MQVEEDPNVPYDDVGGCTAQKEKVREILEKNR
jgi:ATP-dependent 26S proteasome regulatory subunit